jgi:mxaL protein
MLRWRPLFDLRLILLILAALTLIPVFTHPSVSISQPMLDGLFIVDITQSMNVRDYTIGGQPVDRLTYVKSALIHVVRKLPCGSSVGLGLFTGWQTATLFDPIEVCHYRREIEDVIRHIDWRMAWAPQSSIGRGLRNALTLRAVRKEKASLVFLTDGNEAPPDDLRWLGMQRPRLHSRSAGILLGVGDIRPSAIPLMNEWGEMTGYFQCGEQPCLSSVAQDYLRTLGHALGLDYHRLQTANDLLKVLRTARYSDPRPARVDISWAFGAVALALLSAFYLMDALPTPLQRKTLRTIGS